ncbi:MAG: hypothetical protein JNK78_05765 [Planctomycetes bacterium]|nr:hypothetical protein [Planctomycetota bacterium]
MLARAFLLSASFAAAAGVLTAQCVDPPAWSALTSSTEAVTVAIPDGSGGLFAGGTFTTIGGVAAARIARWNGTSWSALAGGVSGTVASVNALLRTSSGLLVVGGTFTNAGGVPANNIAVWNGASWSALGSGIGGFLVKDAVEMPNGDLVVLGNFSSAGGVAASNIARWNGAAWSALGPGVTSPGGMRLLASGDLVVGGSVSGVTGFVARWNGGAWSSVGNLASMVPNAFAELGNGDLIAGGFQTVQRWNGAAWSVAGTLTGGNLTTAYDMARHPDGSAIVVGAFSTVTAGTATSVRGVARLDPLTLAWSDIGSATALTPLGLAGLVGACEVLPDGRILLCQAPALFGGSPRSVLAITAGCPPANAAYGTNCAGSGGPNVLTAKAQPWLGTSMSAVCSGLPTVSISLGVWGLSATNVPLSLVLGQALPGCLLLSFPDVLTAHVASGGIADVAFALPNTPSWAGNLIRLQVVTFEVGGAASSSNGLEFVLGRL